MSSHLPARRVLAHPLTVLLSGHGGVAVITLARNIIAARLLGVENFGIAAGFAIVLSAVEMVTALGAQQMIVQDAEGDAPAFQSSLHMVQMLRGLVGTTVMYLCAAPLAAVLGSPDTAWAFRILAIVPLLTGLSHLDAWRYQRRHVFGPTMCIQIGPALLALLLIWPLYTEFGDYRVLLVAALVQAAGVVVMSHLVAERRFQATFNAADLRRALKFGWPLALNGILLLGVFHGEKIIVAHLRGPADLAVLAMGFTLTLTPALILGRSLQSYALPRLSDRRADPDAFWQMAVSLLMTCMGLGVALAVVLSLSAPLAVGLLGTGFAPLLAVMPVLAVMHGVRVIKTGVSIIALANGATINAALGNLPRIAMLPVIYAHLNADGSLVGALWIATAAELGGLALSYAAIRRQLRAPSTR